MSGILGTLKHVKTLYSGELLLTELMRLMPEIETQLARVAELEREYSQARWDRRTEELERLRARVADLEADSYGQYHEFRKSIIEAACLRGDVVDYDLIHKIRRMAARVAALEAAQKLMHASVRKTMLGYIPLPDQSEEGE